MEIPKQSEPSTTPVVTGTNILDARLKRLECLKKIEDLKTQKIKDKISLDKESLELLNMQRGRNGWAGPINDLLNIANAWYIDNGRCLGTEPALRSIWTDEEMEQIKGLILAKAKKL